MRNGFEVLPPPFPVADNRQAETYAAFLRENAGAYDGVIAVFPNFGDESSTFLALRDAGTPILFQAYPDRLAAMGPDFRHTVRYETPWKPPRPQNCLPQ